MLLFAEFDRQRTSQLHFPQLVISGCKERIIVTEKNQELLTECGNVTKSPRAYVYNIHKWTLDSCKKNRLLSYMLLAS
jgi:hypothetical protein